MNHLQNDFEKNSILELAKAVGEGTPQPETIVPHKNGKVWLGLVELFFFWVSFSLLLDSFDTNFSLKLFLKSRYMVSLLMVVS